MRQSLVNQARNKSWRTLVLSLLLRHYEAEATEQRETGKVEVTMVEWTGKPAYQQVAEDLRRRIAAGEFAASGKLPSLSELQTTYGITVTVARDAIRQLRTDGLAVSHQGKGAFLTQDAAAAAKLADPISAIAELQEAVAKLRSEVGDLRERVAALEGN